MPATATRMKDRGDAVMAALGNDVRRSILRLLEGGPRLAGEIAQGFPISRPAVSKHLRILLDAGLIAQEARGRQKIYRLERAGFAAGHDWLDGFWPEALGRFRMVAENTYDGHE